MTETPVAESTISGTQPEGLSVWIVAEGSDEGMPDLGTVEQLSIRRFESLDALIEALDPDGEKRPDCIALVGCEPLGRTVRGLRDLAPETAVIVWSRRRDKVSGGPSPGLGRPDFLHRYPSHHAGSPDPGRGGTPETLGFPPQRCGKPHRRFGAGKAAVDLPGEVGVVGPG